MNARTLLALTAAAVLASAAPGQTILSNLPATPSTTGTNLGVGSDGFDRTKAVGLTLGAESRVFQSVTVLVSNIAAPAVLSGGIYSSVGGNPGVLLAPFVGVPVATNPAVVEVSLVTSVPFTLQAGVSYWFVLDGPGVDNDLLWHSLTPPTAPTALAGITFDGYRFSVNGGAWSASTLYNGVRIAASVRCVSDLDGNGQVNVEDVELFVSGFLTGCQ